LPDKSSGLAETYLIRQNTLLSEYLSALDRQSEAIAREDTEAAYLYAMREAGLTRRIQAIQRCLDRLPDPHSEASAQRRRLLSSIFPKVEEIRTAMRASSDLLRRRLEAQRHPGLGPRSIYDVQSPTMIDISY